ncbi:MAG: sortase B protein-sorting domain-containing protein [Oscillospiraceae bacterium]|nr:sortase B protein-sorting domain-containing protein [Oscillospiraceae bacterium]
MCVKAFDGQFRNVSISQIALFAILFDFSCKLALSIVLLRKRRFNRPQRNGACHVQL